MEATILFADMVDSSTFSHVHDPKTYDKLVSSFQAAAAGVVKEMAKDAEVSQQHLEAAVRGDELSLIVATARDPNKGADSDDVNRRLAAVALQVAIRLKRRWLLTEENVTRVEAGQPPLGIAVGIHAGPVVVGPHLRFPAGSLGLQTSNTAEGYAINLAKRVETASRSGRFSRVFLTRPIYNRTPADFRQAFVRTEVPQLKGLPVVPTIYEAKGIGHFDDTSFVQSKEFDDQKHIDIYESVVRANPSEVWLLLDLAHKYFDIGQYEKAARKYEAVIEVDEEFAPAHAYLGRAHFRDYRLLEAEACLERAVELNPGQARANNYLAVCLRRNAVLELFRNREERARDLLQRAVHYHDRACRISEGEGDLGFPWAQNALNWTIAQCSDFERQMSLPKGVGKAYHDAKDLDKRMARSDQLRAKRHLTLHTLGFIRLQQSLWGEAFSYLKEAMTALEGRNRNTVSRPDDKGYAERKAEILFHMGLCQLRDPHLGGLEAAKSSWRKAKTLIDEAWGADSHRACDGQYWMHYSVPTAEADDVVIGTISKLLGGGAVLSLRRRRKERKSANPAKTHVSSRGR